MYEEETKSAACKLVCLDPHPVAIMDMCARTCVCLCVLQNEEERVKE